MAALPVDISVLIEQSIQPEDTNRNYITCQGNDNLLFNIDVNVFNKYILDTKYTGKEIITYRGLKIATWFNRNTGCFEGEILFMNHQLDILAKQKHSLFENIHYKYFMQKNDIAANFEVILNFENIKGKTFKLRCYVREMLIRTVDTILAILQNLSIDDTQFKFIASHFQ